MIPRIHPVVQNVFIGYLRSCLGDGLAASDDIVKKIDTDETFR